MQSSEKERLSQCECLTAVKFARYTAVTADKLSKMMLNLTTKLEQAGIIDPKRISRAERDAKLKKMSLDVTKSNYEITELIRRIPAHPQANQIIHALLDDIKLPQPPVGSNQGESISGDMQAFRQSNDLGNNGVSNVEIPPDDPIMSLVTSIPAAEQAITNILDVLPLLRPSEASSGLPDISNC